MNVICIRAEVCKHALACQHGKPHEKNKDCEVDLCSFGGDVKCTEVRNEKKL